MQVGTFIKTPAPQIAELLGLSGLDFGVIDAEHGPFDRGLADLMMIGGRAAGLPLLIRVPDTQAPTLLWALDIGSYGVIVPHVESAGEAAEVVARSRFRGGVRGFSNSGRYANYGTTGLQETVALGDRARVFCQVESTKAVANAAAIAATEGVSGIVIGRADLALSMGETRLDASAVIDASRAALAAARAAGKEAVIVTGGTAEVAEFLAMGATMVIVGSDQSFMRTAAAVAAVEVKRIFSAREGA